ncbi:FliM/FliN family flagellar motor C-terminal domain-containing protein [Xenophilus sp.]
MTQAINAIGPGAAATMGGAASKDAAHASPTASARVIALPEFGAAASGVSPHGDARPVLRDWGALHQIKTRLQVSVGEASLSVGELVGAKAGQVIRLDSGIDQPVTLSIEGHVVARGQLVALDGHFAVRLTELPAPLQPSDPA